MLEIALFVAMHRILTGLLPQYLHSQLTITNFTLIG